MDETILVAFGNVIRAIRIDRSYTQEEMAYLIGCDRAYYAKIEKGLINCSLVKLYQLLESVGIAFSDFALRLEAEIDSSTINHY